MRKILYMAVASVLLTACGNDKTSSTVLATTGQTESSQEVIEMNEALLGKWQGMIEIPQSPLEIILDLQKTGGNISIPAQGLSEFSFESVQYNDSDIEIKIDLAGSLIKIEGTYEKEQIEGTFTQNGQTFPITLNPYTEASITYEEHSVPVFGGELKVALQVPEQPTGELVIIHAGSGPTNKDGNTIGGGSNNSLKMIAESLAEQGIASIRFDKRGIGENTALITKEEDLTFEMYVQDVTSIVDYAKKDSRFTEVHLLGHSEGALIMAIAAQKGNVDSLISVAGAGRPIDEILMEQLAASLPPNLLIESEKTLEQLKAGNKVGKVSSELQSLFRPSVQPYMISWLKYNPEQEISDVKVPILIIQGKMDIQITEEDAENLKSANSKAQLHYFDHMNHVLKDIQGNREQNIASYSNPTLPLANGLVEEIVKFVK